MISAQTLNIRRDARGVVWVELDTPASEVNILTGQVVADIADCLEQLDAGEVSALVFTSAKRNSFINGAQLMLASAVQQPEQIFKLTEPLRRTYQAIADFDAPTIAGVRGSCFGCGVEFSLCFDHRVAADAADTTFYMTEVADYLDGPAFGSTQRLPRLIGLREAVNFLVWGHRLWGRRAERVGLVDRVVDAGQFDRHLDAFVEEVLAGQVSPRQRVRDADEDIAEVVDETRSAIEGLPATYQPVYEGCLELLVSSATKDGALERSDFDAEVRLAGQTLVEPQAQAARSFLYLRQLAERVWVRRAPKSRALTVRQADGDAAVSVFVEELRGRRLGEVDFVAQAEGSADGAAVALWNANATTAPSLPAEAVSVAVELTPIDARPTDAPVTLRRPFSGFSLARSEQRVPSTGTRPLLEIALAGDDVAALPALYKWLDATGFTVVVSTPAQRYAADALFEAFVAPLAAFVADGGAPEDVHATLASFGFVPSPLEWFDAESTPDGLDGVDAGALAMLLETQPGGRDRGAGTARERLVDAIVVSLLAEARRLLADGTLRHASLVDVICRDLLAFPVGKTSLCEYASVARIGAATKHAEALSAWLSTADLREARAYVEEGRDFYM